MRDITGPESEQTVRIKHLQSINVKTIHKTGDEGNVGKTEKESLVAV